MNTDILWGIVGVLLVFGWINVSRKIRQQHATDWIRADDTSLFPILKTIMIISILIALVMVWVTYGFWTFLRTAGFTIGGYFGSWITGWLMSFILGKEGYAIVIQIIATLASVIFLMILVF